MKNQREITEEIGKTELEIEAIKKTGDQTDLEISVRHHVALSAYKNALVWVLNMKK